MTTPPTFPDDAEQKCIQFLVRAERAERELEEVMTVLRSAFGQGRVLERVMEGEEWRERDVPNREVAERVLQWGRTLDRERLHNLGKWGQLIHAVCNADQPELLAEIDGALEDYAAMRADLKAAAGELAIPIPEPGTDIARLMSANVLLRRQNSIERGDAASSEQQKQPSPARP